jgi:hypothetical protein
MIFTRTALAGITATDMATGMAMNIVTPPEAKKSGRKNPGWND